MFNNQTIKAVINVLSPVQQKGVLQKLFDDGMPVEQISSETGIPIRTIYLKLAKKRLQTTMVKPTYQLVGLALLFYKLILDLIHFGHYG